MDWEIYRRPNFTDHTDMGDRHNGNLVIPNRGLCIVFSNGEGWEHVSVSLQTRCPTWDEMEAVKRRFWDDADTVMQLHVPPKDHRNFHPYCLHLWRPTDCEIPRPPGIFVAPDSPSETISNPRKEDDDDTDPMVPRPAG
jgi:hypothetical protein